MSSSHSLGPFCSYNWEVETVLSQIFATQNNACPQGVWTYSTGKWSEIAKETWETPDALLLTKNMAMKSEDNEDPEDCPEGMWVCKKKKMLKKMLKTALVKSSQDTRATTLNPPQVSDDACPPGVWTCSTGRLHCGMHLCRTCHRNVSSKCVFCVMKSTKIETSTPKALNWRLWNCPTRIWIR